MGEVIQYSAAAGLSHEGANGHMILPHPLNDYSEKISAPSTEGSYFYGPAGSLRPVYSSNSLLSTPSGPLQQYPSQQFAAQEKPHPPLPPPLQSHSQSLQQQQQQQQRQLPINVTTEISSVVEKKVPNKAEFLQALKLNPPKPLLSPHPAFATPVTSPPRQAVLEPLPRTTFNLEPRSGGFAIQQNPVNGGGPFSQLQEFKLSDSSHYFEYARSRHLNNDICRLLREEQPEADNQQSHTSPIGHLLRTSSETKRWSFKPLDRMLHRNPPPQNVVMQKSTGGTKYCRIVTDDIEEQWRPKKAQSQRRNDPWRKSMSVRSTWGKLDVDEDDCVKTAKDSTYNVNRLDQYRSRKKAQRSQDDSAHRIARSTTLESLGKRSRSEDAIRVLNHDQDAESTHMIHPAHQKEINAQSMRPRTSDEEQHIEGPPRKTTPPILDPLPKSQSLHFDPETFATRQNLADARTNGVNHRDQVNHLTNSESTRFGADSMDGQSHDPTKAKKATSASVYSRFAQGMRNRSRSPSKRKPVERVAQQVVETEAPAEPSRFQQHLAYLKEMGRGSASAAPTAEQQVSDTTSTKDCVHTKRDSKAMTTSTGTPQTCHCHTPSEASGISNIDVSSLTLSDAKSGKVYPGTAKRMANSISATSIALPGPVPNMALPAVPETLDSTLPSTPKHNGGPLRFANGGVSGNSHRLSPDRYAAFPKTSPTKTGVSPRSPALSDFPNPPESPLRVLPPKIRKVAVVNATGEVSYETGFASAPDPNKDPAIARAEKVAQTKARDMARQISQQAELGEPQDVTKRPSTPSAERALDTETANAAQAPSRHTTDSHSSLEVVTAYSDGHASTADTLATTVSKHEQDRASSSPPPSNHVSQGTESEKSNGLRPVPYTIGEGLSTGAHQGLGLSPLTEVHEPYQSSVTIYPKPNTTMQSCTDRVPTPYKHDFFRHSSNASSKRSSTAEVGMEARLARLELSNKMLVKAFMAVIEATAEGPRSEQGGFEDSRRSEAYSMDDVQAKSGISEDGSAPRMHHLADKARFSGEQQHPSQRDSQHDQHVKNNRVDLDVVLGQLERALSPR